MRTLLVINSESFSFVDEEVVESSDEFKLFTSDNKDSDVVFEDGVDAAKDGFENKRCWVDDALLVFVPEYPSPEKVLEMESWYPKFVEAAAEEEV